VAPNTEVLGHGDPDRAGRRRSTPFVAAVVLLAAVGWWVHQGDSSRVSKSPAGAGLSAPQAVPVQDLSLSEITPYYRLDPTNRRVVVGVLVANNGAGPISLTSVRVSNANPRLDAVLVPLGTASALLLSAEPVPEATFHPAHSVTAIRLRPGARAAVLVSVAADCSTLATQPTAELTIVGSVARAGTPAAAIYTLQDAPNGLAPGWLPTALQVACHPVDRSAAMTVVRRTVAGLVLTTTGPTRPPADEMFTVTLTATNTATTGFRGQLGVVAVDRVRGNGFAGFVGTDPLDTRPHLTSWDFFGAERGGVTDVGSGALLGGQIIPPGASTTIIYYLDASPVSGLGLLGPTHGWTPITWPAGAVTFVLPTSQPDPILVLPK